jgi:hypothetical protein
VMTAIKRRVVTRPGVVDQASLSAQRALPINVPMSALGSPDGPVL